MLRSGLETIGPEFEVIDVPPGEEAFLELTRSLFVLMIADVRLAGMTGIELKAKALTFNPDMKVILITGIIDPKYRQEVADAGADAFFFKPIEMTGFFDTVETLLELETTNRKADLDAPSPTSPSPTPELVDHLASLRGELIATTAVLLHANEGITARVGNLPDAAILSELVPMVLELLNDLSDLFAHAAPTPSHEIIEDDVDSTITETDDDPLTPLPNIEEIFKAENVGDLNSDDFDAYWDSDLEDDVSGLQYTSSAAIPTMMPRSQGSHLMRPHYEIEGLSS